MNRAAACLNSIAQNEANTFAPGAKSFRVAIAYADDLPEEIQRAFEKLRETASANHGWRSPGGGSIPTAPDDGRRSSRGRLAELVRRLVLALRGQS
jgi:hypothetical protein